MPDTTSDAMSSSGAREPIDSRRAQMSQLSWRRSSFCGGAGACVEVAGLCDESVAVRDGKVGADSPVLVFPSDTWKAFIDGIKSGDFK